MQGFKNIYSRYSWQEIEERLAKVTNQEVLLAIHKPKKTIDDFLVLVSEKASDSLELMAQHSQRLTQKRFGKTIQMYAPLYLSNECQNICTYCGFSLDNKIRRKTLTPDELIKEAVALKEMGINHVLLVSGEANLKVGISYFLRAVEILRPYFANISMEVQPLCQQEYILLKNAGVHSILVYQETYHQEVYKTYHPKGKKSNFDFRLETPDRVGKSQMHKIGLGVLLGLENWRVDSFFNALHLDYMQKTYWQTRLSVSFPRLRPAVGVDAPNFIISDRELLQLIFAYRLWNEDLDISISTRENEIFRNHIIQLGATSMSAASKTNPGGYAVEKESLEQFEISDQRSMQVFKEVIKNAGYQPVMKDWESVF